jgi:hypothetical protein
MKRKFKTHRRGIDEETIPRLTVIRRVTPWIGIEYVPTITVARGQEQHRRMQVRAGDEVRGPVSFDQIRRVWALRLLRPGLEVRVIWSWEPVCSALKWLAPASSRSAAS